VQVGGGKGLLVQREGKLPVQKQRQPALFCLLDGGDLRHGRLLRALQFVGIGGPVPRMPACQGNYSSTIMSRSSSLPVVLGAGSAAGFPAGLTAVTTSPGFKVSFLPSDTSRSALSRMIFSISSATSGCSFRKILALSRPWPRRVSP